MNQHNEQLLAALERLDWLCRVGEPDARAITLGSLEEMADLFAERPESFLAPPYAAPYVSLCTVDHDAAEAIAEGNPHPRVQALATAAYLSAWQKIPVPEVCGLVSDDVMSLATMLLAGVGLKPFTLDRLNWYREGRAPWGYEGVFPEGRWIIL